MTTVVATTFIIITLFLLMYIILTARRINTFKNRWLLEADETDSLARRNEILTAQNESLIEQLHAAERVVSLAYAKSKSH